MELCLLDDLNGSKVEVAVKRLKMASFRRRDDLQRFFQEGAMLRKMQHRWACGCLILAGRGESSQAPCLLVW